MKQQCHKPAKISW